MNSTPFVSSSGETRNPIYEGQFEGETPEQAEHRLHWAKVAMEMARNAQAPDHSEDVRALVEQTHCQCGDSYPANSYDAGFIDGSGMCANCDAAIQTQDLALDDWVKCIDRMPESGQTVLAYYLNSHGKGRTIRAMHVKAWTILAEDSGDPDTECVEYSEQEDAYYLLAGWYELIDNWDEYASIAVTEGVITHWQELPAAPPAGSQKGGE